ncbi:MAG: hypothetical protein ACE3L7_13820 [Candidatus Pristimantibacillus sp.]
MTNVTYGTQNFSGSDFRSVSASGADYEFQSVVPIRCIDLATMKADREPAGLHFLLRRRISSNLLLVIVDTMAPAVYSLKHSKKMGLPLTGGP